MKDYLPTPFRDTRKRPTAIKVGINGRGPEVEWFGAGFLPLCLLLTKTRALEAVPRVESKVFRDLVDDL